MSIDKLKEKLKNKQYDGVYFFYGDEEYTKDRYVDMLRKCVTSCPLPEFNHVTLDAEETTPLDLADAIASPPSMCDTKMIEVRHLDVNSAKKAVLEGYIDAISDIPSGCVVLFCMRSGETPDEGYSYSAYKKKSKSSSGESPASAFMSELSSAALTVCFERETGDKLYAWIRRHFISRKVEIDNNAVYTLVEMCGNDMYVLLGEIEKLTAFYSGTSLTRADVKSICCSNEIYKIYELSNAVMKGDLYTAKAVFDNLRLNRTDASTMLSQLSRSFYEALMITAGVADGKNYYEIASSLKMQQNRISAIASGCRGRDYKSLAAAVLIFDSADRRIKSSREDPYLVVETAICRVCANAR